MQNTKRVVGAALAMTLLATVSAGCEKNPKVEAIEKQAAEENEVIDRAEESTKELVEGVVESESAIRGQGGLRQEIEGLKARRAVDEEFDQIEAQHERIVEQKIEQAEKQSP